ncbi:MAG: methyltransferase, TIGR04325 family, partial [bacterium]|nr:methyltransferase, TIGR04325 family [bacterium]
MRNAAKKLVKDLLPPIITRAITGTKRPKYLNFSGNYKSWEEALRHSSGYDTDVILEKVKSAALKVKRGEAAFERDSVAFGKPKYVWPVLAILLWIASQKQNSLTVMDFGGSLGSLYFQHRKFLDQLNKLSWNVVEQPKFALCGKENFEDG